MIINFLNRQFDVPTDAVYVRESGTYARIELPGREGAKFIHYVPCKLTYTCAEPPKPLTVVLTPEMAAHVNASALVDIVVRKPAPVISLWSKWFEVAA